MKAGRMRHRLRIEQPVRDVDGFVGEVKTWAPVLEVNASIDNVSRANMISGREFMADDRELAGLNYTITLRETPGVTLQPDWRGVDVDTGAVFDFHSILPSHDRAVLVVQASSGTAQP